MGARLSISIFNLVWIAATLLLLKVGVSSYFANPDTGLQGLEKIEKVDWLLVGASHVYTGYDIEVLERETGMKFYQVWYPGINPAEIDILLDEIHRNHRQKFCRLMVDVNASLMSTLPQIREADLFFEVPWPVKERLMRLYLQYPRGLGELLELLFSGKTGDILFNLVFQTKEPPQKMDFKEMTEQEWKALRSTHTLSDKPTKLFAMSVAMTAAKLAKSYPGRVWFTETPLPGFRYQDPFAMSLKAETQRIIALNGGQPYFDFGLKGFPIDDRTYFGDQHHLSLKGRALNTEIFLREVVRPEMEKDRLAKLSGEKSLCD